MMWNLSLYALHGDNEHYVTHNYILVLLSREKKVTTAVVMDYCIDYYDYQILYFIDSVYLLPPLHAWTSVPLPTLVTSPSIRCTDRYTTPQIDGR